MGATISSPDDFKSDRYKMSHAMWSTTHNLVAAEGYVTVVNFDYDAGKTVTIPPSMVTAINQLLKRDSLHLLPNYS